MDYTLLLKSITGHISLSREEESFFLSLLQNRKVRKKQMLFHEGMANRYMAFVISGCLRSFSIDKNGFEHVLQFAPPGWWIADIRSLLTGQPGRLNIDAVDDSTVVLLEQDQRNEICRKTPAFERYFRILAENSLATYQHRLIDNLSLPARERYENFCRQYPSLINCLPQKQVAAYIGVTPEFLSKMLNAPSVRTDPHDNKL
ncbi:Crp/Fnr family transcriptional regulator [Compostibacter hankyongensis]|uniref:Crp/Fnr family transcriptional regulator n=1 Tax=Compostibacter hankyongensis TaxID=1007089 RepID=A0ABP8FY24_9BACT